jgi:hypothetical protein
MIKDDCIIICYPAGSGGSFLQSSMRSILKKEEFKISLNLGHCHESKFSSENFVSGDSIESFDAELSNIKALIFSQQEVYAHH